MGNRTFIPGSEWVYFKIYTGTKTADVILKNEISGYVKGILEKDIIDKWFFIRYTDPDFHIRLRLHLKGSQNYSDVFNRFFVICSPLIDAGLVWKIQCDTYQREMERYGANTISVVEDLFFKDSEFVVELLHQLSDENTEQQRWKLALVLIDSFLSVFSYDLLQKKELLNITAKNYRKEFGFVHHQGKKQLDNKFRVYRKDVEHTMLWENDNTETTDIIRVRMQAISLIAQRLKTMEISAELQVSLKALLISMMHMTMNRWFRTNTRLHELVIYDFLSRYYTSKVAKINL